MARLIDKDALVAEIERRKNICQGVAKANENNEFTHLYYKGKTESYSEMSEFLDTLEVKEVDEEPYVMSDKGKFTTTTK